MTRWLRFLIFGSFLGLVVGANGDAIKVSLRLLAKDVYYAPAVPCVPCAIAVLVLGALYAVWLAAATVAGKRMPIWIHLAVIAPLFYVVLVGPLKAERDGEHGAPADRALAAMRAIDAAAKAAGRSPCAMGEERVEQALRDSRSVPPSGYYSHGRPIPFSVKLLAGRSAPIKSLPEGARTGELLVACSPDERTWWISAVLTDAVPDGRPSLMVDGVRKVALVVGEISP